MNKKSKEIMKQKANKTNKVFQFSTHTYTYTCFVWSSLDFCCYTKESKQATKSIHFNQYAGQHKFLYPSCGALVQFY